MNELTNLAKKFAMKLGLESNYTSPGMYEMDSEPFEMPEESGEQSTVSRESLKYDNTPTKPIRLYVREFQVSFHEMKESIDLEDFSEAVSVIENMKMELDQIQRMCQTKARSRKAV